MVMVVVMTTTTWQAYVKRFADGETQQEIATRSGVDQTTVGRWLRGTKVPTNAANAAAFARTCTPPRNPIEAFIAAGMLTVDEAGAALDDDSKKMLEQLRADPDTVGADDDELLIIPPTEAPRESAKPAARVARD